jgi:gas vesicle protein
MGDNKMAKGLIAGFLAGGVVGAVIALLYAPKSGKELRGDIKRKSSELMDEAEEYVAAAKQKANDLINDGKEKSNQLINDAKTKAQTLFKDAERILSDAKGKATDESQRLKTAVQAGVEAFKEERHKS